METKSSLKIKRIVITTFIYFISPFMATLASKLINDMTISHTLIQSIVGFINITYNWDLFALHYNRAKKSLGDIIFFSVVGIILMGILTYININYIYGYILLADPVTFSTYYGGSALILIVLTFIYSFNSLITFKCILDRIKITSSTIQMILFSGLFFGLLISILFVPYNIDIQIASFLFYSILYMICSYQYNQTQTIIPSIISMSIILLAVNIFNIYI